VRFASIACISMRWVLLAMVAVCWRLGTVRSMDIYQPRPSGDDLLWGVVAINDEIHSALLARISDADDRNGLNDMKRVLVRRGGAAIADRLEDVSQEVLEPGPAGDELRRAAGLLPVRFSDLDDRGGADVVAYVKVVDGVLIILAPSTAITSNLPAFAGDRVKLPRNAIMTLVHEAIVRLPGLNRLYVPRMDRLLRRLAFIGQMLDLLREHGVLLIDEGGESDFRDSSDVMKATIKATSSGDQNAIERKQIMIGGRLDALEPEGDGFSGRDFAWYSSPPGYGACFETRGGVTTPVKKSIEPDASWAPFIGTLWRAFAAGTPIAEIALDPLLDGMRLRDGSGRSLGALPAPRRRDRIRQFFTLEMADLHQRGVWSKFRSTAAPIDEANAHVLVADGTGRRGKLIDGRLRVHLVGGLPWGIDAQTWQAVRERLGAMPRHTTMEDRARLGANPKLVFTSTPSFPLGKGWARLRREHGAIQLRVMLGAIDLAPAWDVDASDLLGATHDVTAVQLLGKGLAAALIAAGAGEAILDRAGEQETTMVRALRAQLQDAKVNLEKATAAAEQAKALAAAAEDMGVMLTVRSNLQDVEKALRDAAGYTDTIRLIEEQLVAAQTSPPEDVVELRTPLAVAAALMRWTGEPDELLTRAVSRLELLKHLTARVDPQSGEIVGSGKARLLDPDGNTLLLDYGFRWPNTSNKRTVGVETPELVRCWALGEEFYSLGPRFRQAPSLVRKKVRLWLTNSPVGRMSTALVDCPIALVRQVVVSGIDPAVVAVPDAEAGLVQHLRGTYVDGFGFWKSWLGQDADKDHRALAALSRAPGPVDVAVLAEVGVSAGTLREAGGRPPITLATVGKRQLKPCVHEDCPSPVARVPSYTPETSRWGVVCATCRRVPDLAMAHVTFTAEHVQGWTRRKVDDRLVSVQADSVEFSRREQDLLGADLIRIDELEPILGLTQGGIRSMLDRGQLQQSVRLQGTRLWPRDAVVALAKVRAGTRAHAYGIKDGFLSPEEAGKVIRVPDTLVRRYVQDGLLAAKAMPGARSTTLRISPVVLAAFPVPPGDLLSSMKLYEVAQLAGVPTAAVRAAADSGALPLAPTTYRTPRVTRADAEAFATRCRRGRGGRSAT
jgi:hypothetical protein